MPPRSTIESAGHPKPASSSTTSCFAAPSSPQVKRLVPSIGSIITGALIVLRAFTTRVSGNARWICSPSESSLQTDSVGGIP